MSSSLPPNLDSQSIAEVLESDETTSNFFREELRELPQRRDNDSVSVATTATYKTARGSVLGLSLGRILGGASKDSINLDGQQHFTLQELCDFIHKHPSLQTAGIISCSCYTEPTIVWFIPHRFLILELHREGLANVWLRLDRRPATNVGVVGLSVASGVTPSNDTAVMASSRDKLLTSSPSAIEESPLIFELPSLLSNLRLRLLEITEVMNQYKLASENCWAFCALLLRYFEACDQGQISTGSLLFPKLAQKAIRRILLAESVRHKRFHQKLASMLFPHNLSSYVPFSVLIHDLGDGWDRAVEAARRWEDSDGFSSLEGQWLAGNLILKLSNHWAYLNPDSQLALQTMSLCHQVALTEPLRSTLDPGLRLTCVGYLHRQGRIYADSKNNKPQNLNAALSMFEDATSLLVPGLIRNWDICLLQYDHAIALHALGRQPEAREMVMAFVECVRHEHVGRWPGSMKELRSRGIWPSEFNYLFGLEDGDLQFWEYWREDHSEAPASLLYSPFNSSPSSNSLPSTSSDASKSLPQTRLPTEDSTSSSSTSSPSNGLDVSTKDENVRAERAGAQVQDGKETGY